MISRFGVLTNCWLPRGKKIITPSTSYASPLRAPVHYSPRGQVVSSNDFLSDTAFVPAIFLFGCLLSLLASDYLTLNSPQVLSRCSNWGVFFINSFPRELSPRTFSPLSIYTGVLSTLLVHLIPKQLWYPYCWYHFPRFTDMETEQARLSNLLEIARNNGGMRPQHDIWMRAFNCYVTLLCVQWHQSWKRLGQA